MPSSEKLARNLLGLSALPIIELVVRDGSAAGLRRGENRQPRTVVYVAELLSQLSFVSRLDRGRLRSAYWMETAMYHGSVGCDKESVSLIFMTE